jgi:hypothetical protein
MNSDCAGVTQFDAFETVVANQDVPDVAMLEYHAGFADRDTFAAIGAFFRNNDIGTVIATVDGLLGANFNTLAALRADPGPVCPRLREVCLDFQSDLFGINFIMMADSANLQTQAASAALARYYFNSLYCHNATE